MSAIVVSDTDRPSVQGRLAAIRNNLGKPPGTVLHFAKNIRQHGARVYVCQQLATLTGVTIVSVVMCKRHWTNAAMLTQDPQAVYLYTLRLMLERLSWIARDRGEEIIVTFAHVKKGRGIDEVLRGYAWGEVGPEAPCSRPAPVAAGSSPSRARGAGATSAGGTMSGSAASGEGRQRLEATAQSGAGWSGSLSARIRTAWTAGTRAVGTTRSPATTSFRSPREARTHWGTSPFAAERATAGAARPFGKRAGRFFRCASRDPALRRRRARGT
jgi:hypothetical protein